jgi:hypothetical protein
MPECACAAGREDERVLAFGGTRGARATASAEIIDLSPPDPFWQFTAPLHHTRMHANGVLLPDGTVLAVGGGNRALFKEPELVAELYDPVSETWTDLAAQDASRMYHSTALLLPDGRVLSAGQNHGAQRFTGEVFAPPYLFAGRGPRSLPLRPRSHTAKTSRSRRLRRPVSRGWP